jgi:signal transduction histidine kinase
MTPEALEQGHGAQELQAHKLEVIGQLAAGVAHEINTPSQYVSDNLRFLAEAFETLTAALSTGITPDKAEAIAYLRGEVPAAIEESLAGMRRIAEIVRGIKTFAHPGTGSRAHCDINQMLQAAVNVARSEWVYVADVELDLESELPNVWAFSDEIHHVFLNLIVNASQAVAAARADNDPRGRIRVASYSSEEGVHIRVEDDGPGIPDHIRGRIFDPFFTTKPVGQGTGQGLAICHRVVEHHGGCIRLAPGIGTGAAFDVHLPLGSPSAEAA